jgi:anaerobic selenocysteine-containing dehydrogenase
MSIKSYVPPKKNIIDHRTAEGGYYNAICDVCGTEFFPKRSNARYCSSNCGIVAHRTAIANGDVKKKIKTSNKKTNSSTTIIGKGNVIQWFKEKNLKTYGLQTFLQTQGVGLKDEWEGVTIDKISASKYHLVNTK